MNSTASSARRSLSRPASPGRWSASTRICAEALSGIADPLFPALGTAERCDPLTASAVICASLAEPLELPVLREALPGWLLPHQGDAVRRARGIIRRFGGVLIADGVGLGKTYVALGLAHLERRLDGGRALAVVPSVLRGDWERASSTTGVPVTIRSHTLLERRIPDVPADCSLLLVDEAHAFRNPRTRRYDSLARLAVGRRVALLTATPCNNSPGDLAGLLALFAGRDRFRELGIPDLEEALRAGPDGRAQLALGAVSVCRSRRFVEERWPHLARALPRRNLLPPLRFDLDACYGGALRAVLDALEEIGHAHAAADEPAAALMQLGLLRRLESSSTALASTLRRQRHYLEEAMRAAESGVQLSRREFRRGTSGSRDTVEQLRMWSLLLAHRAEPATRVLAPLRAALERASRVVERFAPPGPDDKARALERLLAGRTGARRILVFTEHRDTALELLRQVRRRHRVLAVTGDGAWAGVTRVGREEALDAFSPRSRGRAARPLLEADVLIATDLASEGMNLQDADTVVNFDLPWNPVRVMQRVGRIDRLDSPHESINVAHLLPRGGLEVLTGVLLRLRDKLALSHVAPSAEPDPLAALWWLDSGAGPEALEREAWRRVAPFEARERWRALAERVAPPLRRPLVSAAVCGDGGHAGVGILLEAAWPGGAATPLPFVVTHGGTVAEDPHLLGELAERAARGTQAQVEPLMLTTAIASVLPIARRRLIALSAARHGAPRPGPGRRAALDALDQAARRAVRDRSDVSGIERVRDLLSLDVPAGLERVLCEMAQARPEAADYLSRLGHVARSCDGHDRFALAGAPRLRLVAALAVASG